MSNAALCDVSRYANPKYLEEVPLPTHMPVSNAPKKKSLPISHLPHVVPPMEEQLEQIQERKYTILNTLHDVVEADDEEQQERRGHDGEEDDIASTQPRDDEDDDHNLQDAGLENKSIVESHLEELSIREPIAANQDLVANFFLEGSAALEGQTFSGYPLFGHRTAEERLSALRKVYDTYGITNYLPANTSWTGAAEENMAAFNTNESREQYWRRMARHFIHRRTPAAAATEVFEYEDPFYMIDLGRVVEQMARWRHCLPMVRPHFAVKCNPSLPLMQALSALGAGFDCASKQEFDMVLSHGLVESPDDIIFANPCKQPGDLKAADAAGVTYVTFDNLIELEKIARFMPRAKAVLRIRTNDSAATSAFSVKFGAPLEEVDGLLDKAREVGVDIYGVSFHVGSGNSDPAAYVGSIRDAHRVFQQAEAKGFNCTLLDIGGGYPGLPPVNDTVAAFEDIAAAIRPVLETLFQGVTVISEPGRYFTTATHALVMHVFATRRLKMSAEEKEACKAVAAEGAVSLDNAEEYQYYVNDGIYQSFNCILLDHAHPQLLLLDDGDGAEKAAAAGTDSPAVVVTTTTTPSPGGSPTAPLPPPALMSVSQRRKHCEPRPLHITTIFGPTCDSLDCILKKQPFPEMRVGDWMLVPDMGSYTTAAGCAFNGFSTRRREFVSSVAL